MSRARRTREPSRSIDLVKSLASGPKHSTGAPGFTVSGVSTPMSLIWTSRLPIRAMKVSPSTTRLTTPDEGSEVVERRVARIAPTELTVIRREAATTPLRFTGVR